MFKIFQFPDYKTMWQLSGDEKSKMDEFYVHGICNPTFSIKESSTTSIPMGKIQINSNSCINIIVVIVYNYIHQCRLCKLEKEK